MKKLTDEKVAKALGWKVMDRHPTLWRNPEDFREVTEELPNWTTSLDAIVAEIEARGLSFRIVSSVTPKGRPKMYEGEIRGYEVCYEPGAPLALCAALLAYLKESK